MFDHIGFAIRDYGRSHAFYDRIPAPLGYGVVKEVNRDVTGGGAHCGYGADGRPQFWIGDSVASLAKTKVLAAHSSHLASLDLIKTLSMVHNRL